MALSYWQMILTRQIQAQVTCSFIASLLINISLENWKQRLKLGSSVLKTQSHGLKPSKLSVNDGHAVKLFLRARIKFHSISEKHTTEKFRLYMHWETHNTIRTCTKNWHNMFTENDVQTQHNKLVSITCCFTTSSTARMQTIKSWNHYCQNQNI